MRLFLLVVCLISPVVASPQPSPLFGNGAVVARDRVTAIFGDGAQRGEMVSVFLAGQNGRGTADDNGRWRVYLEPLAAGGPYEMAVEAASGETIVPDVWVGDVWLCAGQSNMEMALSLTREAPQIVLLPEDRKLRIFSVPKAARRIHKRVFRKNRAGLLPRRHPVRSFRQSRGILPMTCARKPVFPSAS